MAALQSTSWPLLLVAALTFAAGCEPKSHKKAGSSASTTGPSLTVALTRDADTTPNNVIVTATLRKAGGVLAPGLSVSISATGGTAGAVTDHGDGTYSAAIVPADVSGEVPITVQATVSGTALQQQRAALILPTVHPAWGQPEAVRGAVNTPGYEDGPNISPDGRWLVVTDSSPVDAFCCIVGCDGIPSDATSTHCQTVVGSYGPPLRPDFPGAWRIVDSDTVLNMCPKACFTDDYTATGGENFGIPIPPIGGYIFKRQADGSFGEPAFVGLDTDGCLTPTGYSFAGTPSGTSAALVFDWANPDDANSRLYWSPVTLGATNVLANCECTGPNVRTFSNVTAVPLALTYAQTRSNPSFRGGRLWWDNEDATPYPIHVSAVSGDPLPASTFTPAAETHAPVPIGTYASVDHSQPYFHVSANTLYFRSGNVGISAAVLSGNPMNSGDWSAETVIMEGEGGTRTGAIMVVGQPTIGTPPGGTDEMYFVYAMKTAAGTNFNIGVIPKL